MLVTADKGEIVALDTAGYGPFSISQNVSVSGAPGVHAAITATSGNGITVSGLSHVYIQNLFILGGGTGSIGIAEGGAFRVVISNCFIQGFTGYGIQGLQAGLIIDHTVIADCGTGIAFSPSSGSVDHSQIYSCTNGIYVSSTAVGGSITDCTITDTAVRYSTVAVLVDAPASSKFTTVKIERSSLVGNNNNGLHVQAALGTAIVYLSYDFIDHADATGNYTVNTTNTNTIISNALTLTSIPLL